MAKEKEKGKKETAKRSDLTRFGEVILGGLIFATMPQIRLIGLGLILDGAIRENKLRKQQQTE